MSGRMHRTTRRHVLTTGALACGAGLLAGRPAAAQDAAAAQLEAGQLSEKSLGELLGALGLKPTKEQSRYDFQFKTTLEGEKWDFTMSAVLSRNGESLWVMAWLDELPRSAAEVPRSSLLKMLAANDRMGGGKFFAYIPANRRFVLQRVVPNAELSNKAVRELLIDLGRNVRSEYGVWSVAGWSETGRQAAARTAAGTTAASANDSKYGKTTVR